MTLTSQKLCHSIEEFKTTIAPRLQKNIKLVYNVVFVLHLSMFFFIFYIPCLLSLEMYTHVHKFYTRSMKWTLL